MANKQSIITLDPIDAKKKQGFLARLLVTRWFGGKPVQKSEPFGHYMFCGSQGSGKTSSVLWYAEMLIKKYTKPNWFRRKILRKKPFTVVLYSNYGVGREIHKRKIFETISNFDPYKKEIRIVLLDEIQTYFPKGSIDKETKAIQSDLVSIFSQLRKRNTFILSTAQVYGRLDKSLREQCLYMVNCKVNLNNKIVNDFIPGDDIICDDLGRWSGTPKKVYVHGLSSMEYDTKRVIKE